MTTVLITGANKGLGKGFVTKYRSRPNTTVIGGVRNPSSSEAQSLNSLPKASGSKLILVKIESTSDTDASAAVASLQKQGISHLDIVIANAGIYKISAFVRVDEMKTTDLMEHFDVNAAGTVRLFQAVLPLLQKGTRPRFMAQSSIVSTIGAMEHIPFSVPSYGASKSAINFLVKRIHIEHPELIAFVVHPGAAQSEEGDAAARFFGLDRAPTPVEESVNGLVAKVSFSGCWLLGLAESSLLTRCLYSSTTPPVTRPRASSCLSMKRR